MFSVFCLIYEIIQKNSRLFSIFKFSVFRYLIFRIFVSGCGFPNSILSNNSNLIPITCTSSTAGSNLARGNNALMSLSHTHNSISSDNLGVQHNPTGIVPGSVDVDGVATSFDMTSFFSSANQTLKSAATPHTEYSKSQFASPQMKSTTFSETVIGVVPS